MEDHPILFFDGVCNLCNKVVDFFIQKDQNQVIRYSSLQGETAKQLLDPKLIENMNTVVFLEKGITYIKSEAVIRALIHLGPKYALSSIFLVFPSFVRDPFYNLVAATRYKFFGKRDSCRLPTHSEKKLFLD
jgi:predicted DCC family thiol-disulfide oxidoreductase YuxK